MVVNIIIVILLFFLPFIVFPFGVSPFEIPKVIVAESAIEVLLLIFLFTTKSSLTKISNRLFNTVLIGLALLTIIQLLVFRSPQLFFGNVFRLQGIFLLWHLLAFSYLVSRIQKFTIPPLIPILSLSLLAFSLLLFGTNNSGRFVGTLGEPNALAASAIFIWPFAFLKNKKITQAFMFLIALALLLLSGSRSGFIAFAIQSIFIFIKRFPTVNFGKATIISLVLILVSYFLPYIEQGKLYENRSEIWNTALLSGLESPFIGHGFGNIQNALKQTSWTINNNVQFQIVDSSHNFLLDWWVQTGVIGTGLLIVLISTVFINFIRKKQILETTVFMGLITVLSFNPASITSLIGFWWLIARAFVKNHE